MGLHIPPPSLHFFDICTNVIYSVECIVFTQTITTGILFFVHENLNLHDLPKEKIAAYNSMKEHIFCVKI